MRHLILFCFIIFSLSAYASERNRAEVLREKILSGDTTEVLVVAHRGDWRYAPENSIAAIEHSIAIGVDIVELDLQLSKDSVLFVIHDSKIDRTTNGKGRIGEWTADSLRNLVLKNGAGIRTKNRLPTLEEVMLVAKGRVLVNLDKADRYFDLVMPVLERTGTASQVIMKGNRTPEQNDSLYGKYLGKVIYMPKVRLDKPDSPELIDGYLTKLQSPVFELSYSSDDTINYPMEAREKLKGKALI